MNQQQIFNTVALGIRKQGGPSLGFDPTQSGTEKVCLYRGANGRKCAAGHVIPDAEYRPAMEGTRIGAIWGPQDEDAAALLRDLQSAHDNAAMQWNPVTPLTRDPHQVEVSDEQFLGDWRQRMIRIAEQYELNQLALLVDKDTPPEMLTGTQLHARVSAEWTETV